MEKKVSTVHLHDWGMDFLVIFNRAKTSKKKKKNPPEGWNSVLYIKSLVKTKQNKNKPKRRGRANFLKKEKGTENKGRGLIASPQLSPWSPPLRTPCSPPPKELLAFQPLSRHYHFCPILLSFLSLRSLSCILQTLS